MVRDSGEESRHFVVLDVLPLYADISEETDNPTAEAAASSFVK